MPQGDHENAGFGFWGDAESPAPEPNSIRDYRERARRLRALAADTSDAGIRMYLLTTAAQFDRLADYAAASARPTDAT
jgi:hypothetical protein